MKKLAMMAAAMAAGTAMADVSLSGIFSDNMVLQRGKGVPVWGKAAPGEKVTVSFVGKTAEATADAKGDWTATRARSSSPTHRAASRRSSRRKVSARSMRRSARRAARALRWAAPR